MRTSDHLSDWQRQGLSTETADSNSGAIINPMFAHGIVYPAKPSDPELEERVTNILNDR